MGVAIGKTPADAAESETLSMPQHSNRENREIPLVSQVTFDWERSANLSDGTADMNADGKSHDFIVLSTRANKAATAVAESLSRKGSHRREVLSISRGRTGHSAGHRVIAWLGNHDW